MLLQDPSGLVDTTPTGSQTASGLAVTQLWDHQQTFTAECQASAVCYKDTPWVATVKEQTPELPSQGAAWDQDR